jgi:hypothetical protein
MNKINYNTEMHGNAHISQRDAMAAAMKTEGTPLDAAQMASKRAAVGKRKIGRVMPTKSYGDGTKKIINKTYFKRKPK